MVFLIKLGAYWAVSLMLTIVALAWAWLRWQRPPARLWLTRFLLTLLLVRFAMPVVTIGSEFTFQLFLADDYAAGQASIDKSAGELVAMTSVPGAPAADENISDKMKRWWSQTTDVKQRYADLKEVVSRAIEHIIKLIVVFLLQTLVLPLLLLWLLLKIVRVLTSMSRPRDFLRGASAENWG